MALTPNQVREYGVPNTPLKKSEKRATKWIEATGVEQTEIDAIATLRPDGAALDALVSGVYRAQRAHKPRLRVRQPTPSRPPRRRKTPG